MLHAYAWASGLIEFGKYVPGDALELLAGDAEMVKYRIRAFARLADENESWLVPGVPEANTPEQKMHAMRHFAEVLDVDDEMRTVRFSQNP